MSARKLQSNALPFNLESVTAILSGRLDRKEAACRARMLLEDVPRLGGPLRLRWHGQSPREACPYYVFTNNVNTPEIFRLPLYSSCNAVGYGLDWGDLVTLSQAVLIARRVWGRYWVREFRERMTHFNNHLSTVEELWWLGLWDSPSRIERECAYCAPRWRSVDWQFQTQGVVINLEVKYRPYDWLRFVDAECYVNRRQHYFDGLAEKFPCKCDGQVNLVAMTLLGSLGCDLQIQAAEFLRLHPPLWSIARRDTLDCECVLRPEREYVRALLRPADEEDRWRNPFMICTRRQSQEKPFAAWPDFDPLAVPLNSAMRDVGAKLQRC
jgi:hypothetical protein